MEVLFGFVIAMGCCWIIFPIVISVLPKRVEQHLPGLAITLLLFVCLVTIVFAVLSTVV